MQPVTPPPPPWYFDSDVLGFGQVLVALIAIIVAGIVAFRQLRVMQKQTQLMDEQTEISKRIETLTTKQAEIAEVQHNIMQEQLTRRSNVRVRVIRQESGYEHDGGNFVKGDIVITLNVFNAGKRTAVGCDWEIFVPEQFEHLIRFRDFAGFGMDTKFVPFSETEGYHRIDGHISAHLYPGSMFDVAEMRVVRRPVMDDEFFIRWRTKSDDGLVPEDGLNTIHFKKRDEDTYAWKYEKSKGEHHS